MFQSQRVHAFVLKKNSIKTKRNRKWKITHTVLERRTLCFRSNKNRKLNETVMSWSSRKKKGGIFVLLIFDWRNFFSICLLSQCIVCWIHFEHIHTFTYQKNITSYTYLPVFKINESVNISLSPTEFARKSFPGLTFI